MRRLRFDSKEHVAATTRRRAILASPEAKGRENLAHFLVSGTNYTTDQCQRILGAAPRGAPTGPTPSGHGTLDATQIYAKRAEAMAPPSAAVANGGNPAGAMPNAATVYARRAATVR